jgi:hypothetical protein
MRRDRRRVNHGSCLALAGHALLTPLLRRLRRDRPKCPLRLVRLPNGSYEDFPV